MSLAVEINAVFVRCMVESCAHNRWGLVHLALELNALLTWCRVEGCTCFYIRGFDSPAFEINALLSGEFLSKR